MPAVIDAEQATWISQGGPTITIASCSPALAPSLGQGIGVRIDAKRERFTVFLLEPRNLAVIADLRAERPAALVLTHSGSLRSLQLKAARAREVSLAAGDSERIGAYVGAVVLQWTKMGVPEMLTRTLLARGPGAILAFEIKPHVAFDQTPGPRAGTALSAP